MTRRLPAGWESCPLSDVADVRSGLAKGRKNIKDPVLLPYLRVANVQDGRLDLREVKTIEVARALVERYRLRPGDVLLTEGGDNGKLGRGTVWQGEIEPCIHQNHVFAVRVNAKRMDPWFLASLAESSYGRSYFHGAAKQTTSLATINKAQVKAFPVLLPPLPEQRKIAAVLSSVDSTIEQTEAVIEQIGVVKKALLQQLLTRGLPGRHTRFKRTEIGALPEDWEVVRLEGVMAESKYGTSRKCHSEPRGVPTLRIPNVVSGKLSLDDLKYTELSVNDAGRWRLATGDLLVARSNGNPARVGRSAVVQGLKGLWAYASYLIRVRVDRARLLPELLHLALRTDGVRDTMRGAIQMSAGSYNLNKKGLGATAIPLPSLAEQREIVELVAKVSGQADAEQAVLDSLRTTKAALLSALLTGEVRVTPG